MMPDVASATRSRRLWVRIASATSGRLERVRRRRRVRSPVRQARRARGAEEEPKDPPPNQVVARSRLDAIDLRLGVVPQRDEVSACLLVSGYELVPVGREVYSPRPCSGRRHACARVGRVPPP